MNKSPTQTTATRQRGGALLIMVAFLVIGVASAGLIFGKPALNAELQDDRTADVLARVKQALIGWSAQRGVAVCSNPGNATQCAAELAARPGELPCPDLDNDGFAEAVCSQAIDRLGRVPWRTLGIPEPKDNAGETLWYAVALPFLPAASNSGVINSSTAGNIEIRASNGVTPITTQAIAVLFSPGVAFNGQNRSDKTADKGFCSQAKQNEFRNRCPANYLEAAAGVNNSVPGGPYVVGTRGSAYNDRLIYIAAADLMPTVEMRVGGELKNLLLAYRENSKCRCYPWADSWNYSGGIPDVGINRGRFPAFDVKPVDWGFQDAENDIPPLPDWVTTNNWNNMVFYSAARQETDEAGRRCYFCSTSPTLVVDTQAVSALVFTPGTPRKGVNRPATHSELVNNLPVANNMSSYLEDALNNNKGPMPVASQECRGWDEEHANSWTGLSQQTVPVSCDTYVRPTSRGYDRDRLFTIPTKPGAHCATAARALVNLSPCLLNMGACLSLQASLQTCSCAGAALNLSLLNVVQLNLCFQ
jgi:hypothetical protein